LNTVTIDNRYRDLSPVEKPEHSSGTKVPGIIKLISFGNQEKPPKSTKKKQ
jgi:hypothetical protein